MPGPAFFDDDGLGARPLLVWTAGVIWLLAAGAVLVPQPLSSAEAALLAAAASHLDGVSPPYALLLRAAAALGPPAELLLRALGLAAVPLLALALYRLCAGFDSAALARRRRETGRLVALCVACHGAALLATVRLGPGNLLWGALALLILAFVRATRRPDPPPVALGLLAAAGLLAVTVEPLALACVAVLAGWLWRASRQPTAATALLVPAALAVSGGAALGWISFAEPGVPDLLRLAASVAGLAPRPALAPPLSSFFTAAAPVIAITLAALAAAGVRRAPRAVAVAALGLLATAVLVALLRAGSSWNGSHAALLVPPLVVLGAWYLTSLPQNAGPDRRLWLYIFLGISAASGLGVLATYRHEETRDVARVLAADERSATRRTDLARAIAFYRHGGPGAAGRGKRADLWHPGDRRPRKVLVEAFGQRVGRLWVTRPAQPVYDLGLQLARARVSYAEAGRVHDCYWQPARNRFRCRGPDYLRAMWSFAEFDGVEADAMLVHPLDDGVLELRWEDVPMGERLFGLAGLDDRSLAFSRAPVHVEIRIGDRPPVKLARGERPGLQPFEIDTRHGPERADIVFRVTTDDDRGRHLFIDALVL